MGLFSLQTLAAPQCTSVHWSTTSVFKCELKATKVLVCLYCGAGPTRSTFTKVCRCGFFYYLMCVFVVFFGAQCVQLPLPDDMVASTFAVLLLFDFNTEEFDYALNLEKKIIMKWALITKPAGKHAGWNGINPHFNLLSHFPNMSQEAELEMGSPTEPCYRHHIAPKHSGFVLKMFQHV